MAKEGVTTIEDTTLWEKMPGSNTDEGDITAFQKELENIFIATKQFKTKELSGDYLVRYNYLNSSGGENFKTYEAVFLNDGSIMYYYLFKKNDIKPKALKIIKSLGAKHTQNFGYIFVDVNGLKKPNKFGRDLFSFVLTHDGTLIPDGSKEASILELHKLTSTWDSDDVDYNCLTTAKSQGYGCAGRIIEEGWEIKY